MSKKSGSPACIAVSQRYLVTIKIDITRTDVGGGAVNNTESNYLARIPLRWMIRECFNCNSGIVFDARMLQKIGLPVRKGHASSEPILEPLYTWHPNEPRKFATPPKKGKSNDAAKAPTTVEVSDGELSETTPNEYEEDLADIITDEHDQLQRKLMWKIMEYIPMYLKTNKAIKADEKAGYKWRYVSLNNLRAANIFNVVSQMEQETRSKDTERRTGD